MHETAINYIASSLIAGPIFTGFWHNFNRYRPNGYTLPKLTPELANQHKKTFIALCKIHNREGLLTEDIAILTPLIHQLTGDQTLEISEETTNQDGKGCLYQYASMILGRTSDVDGQSSYTFVPCDILRFFTDDGPFNDKEIQQLKPTAALSETITITEQPKPTTTKEPDTEPIQNLMALILRKEAGITGTINLNTRDGRSQLSQMLFRATTLLPEWIYDQAITDAQPIEYTQITVI